MILYIFLLAHDYSSSPLQDRYKYAFLCVCVCVNDRGQLQATNELGVGAAVK
jgi:hypothetical protein